MTHVERQPGMERSPVRRRSSDGIKVRTRSEINRAAFFNGARMSSRSKCVRQIVSAELAVSQNSCEESASNRFPRMDRNDGCAAVRVPQEVVASANPRHLEPKRLKRGDELLAGEARQLGHLGERQPLYPNELELLGLFPCHFQAELGSFTNALHQLVEGFRLGVATLQFGDGGDIKAIPIPLDDDVEFSFHRTFQP